MESLSETTIAHSIRVVRFDLCECDILDGEHLSVSPDFVPLEHGNAVAISYAWGEFSRRDVVLGHYQDGASVSMTLGCEWSPSQIVTRLFEMGFASTHTDSAMPFWIDQLCIRQDDEAALRTTLASIPRIYATLDVVALMPGSPCKCLQEGLDAFETYDVKEANELEISDRSAAWVRKVQSCLNSTSFCSYFQRLWTRQEMMYARNIHVEWTHSEPAQCIYSSESDIADMAWRMTRLGPEGQSETPNRFDGMAEDICEKLTPFACQVFKRALSEGLTCTKAFFQVIMSRDASWQSALMAIDEQLAQKGLLVHRRHAAVKVLNQFLARKPLRSHWRGQSAYNQEGDDPNRLQEFLSRLSGLGRTRRSTTKTRDYVLAVWVDCPKYVLPSNYKTLGLPLLLEDAILQLEKNFRKSIPVTAIAGLFGSPEASALWRPSLSLADVDVSNVRQVYGTVLSGCPLLPLTETGCLPLNLHHRKLGRSSKVRGFDWVYGGAINTAQVIEYMQDVVARWPVEVVERIGGSMPHTIPLSTQSHLEMLRGGCRMKMLLGHAAFAKPMSDATSHNSAAQEALFRHDFNPPYDLVYDAAFELVCDALGLDFKSCRQNAAVYLVVHPSNHPSIGFIGAENILKYVNADDIDNNDENDNQMLCNNITVCRDIAVWTRGPGAGCTVIEAARVPSRHLNTSNYYATGVWVSQEITPFTDIQGLVDVQSSNTMLV